MGNISLPIPFRGGEKAQEKLEALGLEGTLLPGLLDVHVHFRVPGRSDKEDILSGSMAALHGGYSDVCTMPNLSPVPDSLAHLEEEETLIERDAKIHVHPYASLTKGEKGQELSDIQDLSSHVVAFSDDGKGIQDEGMMLRAMEAVKKTGMLMALHCEVNALTGKGVIHEGEYARCHHHLGIPSASEYEEVRRDIALAKKTGVKLHICHISTKESLNLIREAKKEGVDITCETAPHYLLLDESMLEEDGAFKMKPPLALKEDREALLEGIKDGSIDMIATDHAPHTKEEKAKGLDGSSFGIVGLETAFPLLYTSLVKTGMITLSKLLDLLCFAPRRRFSLPLEEGDCALWDLDEEYRINPENFFSKGRSTPFRGWKVKGRVKALLLKGEIIWQDSIGR